MVFINKNLIQRCAEIYNESGLRHLIRIGVNYLIRQFLYNIGRVGLYNSDAYLRAIRWMNGGYGRYTELADPFAILEVDPHQIEYVTGRMPYPGRFKWQDIGGVAGGDWDQSTKRVDELPVVQAIEQRYSKQKDWGEIEFVRRAKQEAEKGNPIWRGRTSAKDVENACCYVDDLYNKIRNQGYMTRSELLEKNKNNHIHNNALRRFEKYDEVTVDIGRDGEFLFVDGRHRLAIARVLDLDYIPIRVSVRHKQWQEYREQILSSEGSFGESVEHAKLSNHPDLYVSANQ